MDIVLDGLMVHPAVLVQLLVVIGITIELWPYGNHEATTHLMNAVEHGLRIGES